MKPTHARRPNETICQHAYRLLKYVPAKNWIVDNFTDEKASCCAIGHYERLTSADPKDYSIRNCAEYHAVSPIRLPTESAIKKLTGVSYMDIAAINNSPTINGYTEPLIKARVLHFLRDAIKAGF